MQALSNTLIEATTIRYANILQKSPALRHVVNTHGADRKWGSTHPDDCAQETTSTHHQQMHKSMPQSLKQTNSVKKSLGVVFLDDATQEEINNGNLSLIITIPPRCMNIHPPPNTRFPKKKGTSGNHPRHQLQRENRKQHRHTHRHTHTTTMEKEILSSCHDPRNKPHCRAHQSATREPFPPRERLARCNSTCMEMDDIAHRLSGNRTQRRPIRCEPTQRLRKVQ
jgi:hypothetical protein